MVIIFTLSSLSYYDYYSTDTVSADTDFDKGCLVRCECTETSVQTSNQTKDTSEAGVQTTQTIRDMEIHEEYMKSLQCEL